MSRFEAVLHSFRQRFPQRGTFTLPAGGSIRRCVAAGKVPSCPGVYIIRPMRTIEPVSYIGKAGTMRADGTWSTQLLNGRLCNKQAGIPRQQFFQNVMEELKVSELCFEWFVTVGQSVVLPCFAEAELLQAFFDDHLRLPKYNDAA